MDDDAAPYALQVALLDFKGLDKEILKLQQEASKRTNTNSDCQ
jgi:hypothetical protein